MKPIRLVTLCSAILACEAMASPIEQLEAKWHGVMTEIRGWNEEGLRQFREGYRDYPAEVLERALEARTFEKMMGVLDAHATVRSQAAMQKAIKHAVGETLPSDAKDPKVAEAKRIVAKSLGDDARDLVFIPITPCTVWDTRFATDPNAAGLINSAATKRFFSHLDGAGGSYAAWGGNPSCPETAQNAIGFRPFAVMMTVYINDASAQGWLTLYRDGDPDPSLATISVYYSPGPTRTQTVISKSSRGYGAGAYDIAATSRFGNVNASASITGYFVKVTDGYVSEVTASAPLASTGGTTPNVSFAAAPANTVLAGGAAPAFTGSPTISGTLNFTTSPSTPTGGVIYKGGGAFMHDFGVSNTFLGQFAGNLTVLTGDNNVGVGWIAMNALTSGDFNTGIGSLVLTNTTSGVENTAAGYISLVQNTTGSRNTSIGSIALVANTTGSDNTAVGQVALVSNITGSRNIAVGSGAGVSTTGSDNILIGNFGPAGENGTIRIGQANQTRFFAAGVRGVTTANANAVNVLVDSAGQLGTISSSAAVKDAIADMADSTANLMKLRPVTFQYKQYGPGSPLQYGLIAEEVDRVYPGLVTHNDDGSAQTVMYQFLPPMLLNEFQKLRRTVDDQAARIHQLEQALQTRKGETR